jgi:uncharacterized circularly permuted ATP-grasp superfamily protein/uncharacterized alpha-E superfamily protein
MDSGGLEAYSAPPGRFDELLDDNRAVRPHWQAMARAWSALGDAEVVRRQGVAERLLVAESAGHTFIDEHRASAGPWELDPLPYLVDPISWAVIERGLEQRHRLLDAVLTDLAGPARLVEAGVVPAAAVFGSRSYAWAMRDVPVSGPRLTVYAADVVRGSHGRFVVLRDHTDAPRGAGSALLNRTVLARLFPDAHRTLGVQPLDPWFDQLRAALAAIAPATTNSPRTLVLGPPPSHPDFVEVSFLATHLGLNVADADDLAVRDGQVWLRALDGLERLDVLWRCVADSAADQLELPGTTPGVPGLVEAVREGTIGVANTPGTALGDRLLLQPFLAAACQHLFGEPLALSMVDTLWLGDDASRAEVFAGPADFVLHDTSGLEPVPSVFGARLSSAELTAWAERVAREPHRYVAQRTVDFATTPTFHHGRLEAGVATIRVPSALGPDGVRVMPGGIGRHALSDQPIVAAQATVAKDVWVIGGRPQRALPTRVTTILPEVDLRSSLPTRAAEALFWLGRNAERAEHATRVARLVVARAEQDPELFETPWVTIAVNGLRSASGGAPTIGRGVHHDHDWRAELDAALGDRSGALGDAVSHLVANASAARGYLSSSSWRAINLLAGERAVVSKGAADLFVVAESLDRMSTSLAALAGLSLESVVRGPGWRFLDLGRRIERVLLTVSLLEATLSTAPAEDVAQGVYAFVLASTESLVAYRRRYRSDVRLESLRQLVVEDDTNPRAVAFQLDRIGEHLAGLPWRGDTDALRDRIADANEVLWSIDFRRSGNRPDEPIAELIELVLRVRGPMLDLVTELVQRWFSHPTARRLRPQG